LDHGLSEEVGTILANKWTINNDFFLGTQHILYEGTIKSLVIIYCCSLLGHFSSLDCFQSRNYYYSLLKYAYMRNKEAVKIGKELRKARESSGLTQAEVAEKSGITTNYYAMVERGEKNITYGKMQRILKVLNIKSLDIS